MEYYNGAGVLSADCPINFSIGNRSTGKSYYWKRYCIKQWFKNKRKFIYLRRNDIDIDISINEWFDDIGNEYPTWKVVAKANKFYIGQPDENGDIQNLENCGYYFSMNKAAKIKSIPLQTVDTIFFDEFIPEDGRYLKPSNPYFEPQMLMSIYLTVARGYKQVIRPEVKVICAANMITMYNPYFSLYGIDLTNRKRQIHNNVYAEITKNDAVADAIRNEKIGKVLMSTGYGSYALDNVSQIDDFGHIAEKPANSKLQFQIYLYKWYQAYMDRKGYLYFTPGYDMHFKENYQAVPVPGNDKPIPLFEGEILKRVKKVANNDYIYYNDMCTKNAIQGLLLPKRR